MMSQVKYNTQVCMQTLTQVKTATDQTMGQQGNSVTLKVTVNFIVNFID